MLSEAREVCGNGILDIGESLTSGPSLADASRERRHLGHEHAVFILFEYHPVLSSHAVSKHEEIITIDVNSVSIRVLQLTSNLLVVGRAYTSFAVFTTNTMWVSVTYQSSNQSGFLRKLPITSELRRRIWLEHPSLGSSVWELYVEW